VAIAVKGRFKTVGQATAGLTTANETLTINAKYSLALTSGLMTDLQGRHFPTVTPDMELDDDSLKGVLNNGRL
jgi:C-terminal processing protease CtpA/Prc